MRRAPRFSSSASAEVIADGSFELTRVSEISRYGCYLETSTPLEPGTVVTVKIMDGGQLFEATATVLYSRPPRGVGVAFRDVKSVFQTILEDWLSQSVELHHRIPRIEDG
jgi:PilZ domain